MKRTLLFITGILCIVSVAARTVLGFPDDDAAQVSVYIADLESGKVLVEENSARGMIPASNMKLVTTAAALTSLGRDFRFATEVMLCGASGADGTWAGDIVVRGAADPTLESGNFKENLGFCDSIVANLQRLGINHITGQILVEQELREPGPLPTWLIDDVAYDYGAGLFGFNYRDNVARVWPATAESVPYVPDLVIYLEQNKEGTELIRGVHSPELYASAPDIDNPRWCVHTTVPDPAAVFEAELAAKLSASGITLDGAETDQSEGCRRLYVHYSPTSDEIFRSLMVRSDNLFAEGMLRALAPQGSLKDALKAEKEILARNDVATSRVMIFDGSGLSRKNYVSAKFLADVLASMAGGPLIDAYASYFPRAGVDGTLKNFLKNRPVSGTFALKTGSMQAIQCYAGYRLDDEGHPTHVVVVLVNSFFCERAKVRESIEMLLQRTFPKR